MNYYALIYNLIDNYITERAKFRDEHLKLASAANKKGELIIAGAFSDPPDKALLIFRAQDKTIIENFVKNDPYFKNGLITSYEIREWTVVIGNE
jgi:uncharacterized protein